MTDLKPIDIEHIKLRMAQLEEEYRNAPLPKMLDGRFAELRWYAQIRAAQRDFYAAMHHYEDLLYATPVLPLQAESTTTIVPYVPAGKPRRGRPSTGGRKPRPTTRKERLKESD